MTGLQVVQFIRRRQQTLLTDAQILDELNANLDTIALDIGDTLEAPLNLVPFQAEYDVPTNAVMPGGIVEILDEKGERLEAVDPDVAAYWAGVEDDKPLAWTLTDAVPQKIRIIPKPTKSAALKVRYVKRIPPVAADNNQVQLQERFHMLLVYKGAAIVARIEEDNNKANGWELEYQELLARLVRDRDHSPRTKRRRYIRVGPWR